MKWTTANVKSPQYTETHEIYVGTHTGSFKKLTPGNEEQPYAQVNLQELSALDKDSKITALAFTNDENILIGRANNAVQLHSLRSNHVVRSFSVESAPVVGVASYDDNLIAGFENGQVQRLSMAEEQDDDNNLLLSSGDNMTHLRQCLSQRNIIATGGKERKNNLKVFDMAAGGKQVFNSKNLPNDFLQLEVPIWDTDISFIDTPHTIATCSRYGYVRVYDTRKQRRPVQCFASTEPQMSFATITAKGNYIYAGTTMGSMKAFDVRRLKNFVHTYKGFTGSISDICLDSTGKFLASSSLDRYVRIHHTDSCVLLYQCYVKSKATRVLLRESSDSPNEIVQSTEEKEEKDAEEFGDRCKRLARQDTESADEEYERMFNNMQTIRDGEDDLGGDKNDHETGNAKSKVGDKRKFKTKNKTNKKKKN